MKKFLKIFAITIGSIFLLLLCITLLAGPIAKTYIEKHSKEICNRTISIEKVKINIFRGIASIQNFVILEEDDKSNFITFEELKVNINLAKLLSKTVKITEITLVRPHALIEQNGNQFNFTDIIHHFSSEEKETTSSPSSWIVMLQNISLQDGFFSYKDVLKESYVGMKELSLAIPELSFGGEKSDADIHFKFENGGDFSLKMDYNLQKDQYNVNLIINQLGLDMLKPYLMDIINISDFTGLLTTHLQIQGSVKHLLELKAWGDLTLTNVSAIDIHKNPFAAIEKLQLDIQNIDLKNNCFHFDNLIISGVNCNYLITPEYNTLSLLTSTEQTNTDHKDTISTNNSDTNQTTPSSYDVAIRNFEINSSSITYSDHTLKQKFHLPINQISATAKNITLNQPINLNLHALIGEGGVFDLQWQGTITNFSNQHIFVYLKNLRMKDISPYCVHYTAYPISDGILNFKSENNITNNLLQSENNLQIYNCKIDKKIKELDPEFNIPLRAALYVLTDRKGYVDLDLPVEGDIASPQFSFKKAIFKVLTNLMVKVATSPINFILNAEEKNQSIFADLSIPLDATEFSAVDYSKLNKITEFLKEKEKMNLTVDVIVNPTINKDSLSTTDSTSIPSTITQLEQQKMDMLIHYFQSQNINTQRIIKTETENRKAKKNTVLYKFGLMVTEELEQ